jgi:hypothetical protein
LHLNLTRHFTPSHQAPKNPCKTRHWRAFFVSWRFVRSLPISYITGYDTGYDATTPGFRNRVTPTRRNPPCCPLPNAVTPSPRNKPYKLADIKGLYLEVKPNGRKAWRYRFELVREGERRESVDRPHRGDRATGQDPPGRGGASPWPRHGKNAPRPARWYDRASIRRTNAGMTGSSGDGRAQPPSRPWRPSGWRLKTGSN